MLLCSAVERNPDNYNESVRFLENHPDVLLHEDVRTNGVFNKLTHFHVCQPGLPPCLAHDLFEGVVDFELALGVQFLDETKKWFTYD